MSATYLFAGGGTGGHLFPGIAVAEVLRQRHPAAQILFVGSDRELERRILAEQGWPHVALSLSSLQQFWQHPGRFVWQNGRAVVQARRILAEYRPRVVIGLGGLSSVPLVWAAHRARVPVVLLEQNAIPGRATRWLAQYARVVCVAFPECIDYLPKHVPVLTSGNPVRRAIAELHQYPPESLHDHSPALLVLGGSQGAEPLNAALMELVRRHTAAFAGWTILHQTGSRQRSEVAACYEALHQPHQVADFFPDMAAVYRRARLVISRAGATTLAELACAGKPMLLVPYPQAAQNHQQCNAQHFAAHGAAAVVSQAESSGKTAERLWAVLESWLNDATLLQRLGQSARALARPDAVERVVSLLDETLRSAA